MSDGYRVMSRLYLFALGKKTHEVPDQGIIDTIMAWM